MENKNEQKHCLEEAGALASCPFLAESSLPFIRLSYLLFSMSYLLLAILIYLGPQRAHHGLVKHQKDTEMGSTKN